MNDRDYYEQGMRDYLRGVPQSKNPMKQTYGHDSYQYESWLAGWRQARDIKFVMDNMPNSNVGFFGL